MKPPPTLPPGVTVENRAVKFSGWQGKTAYYSEGDRKIDLFKSDAKGSQDPTSKFEVFGASYNMNKTLKEEQRGTKAAKSQRVYDSSLMRSINKLGYTNPIHTREDLKDITPEYFKASFDRYAGPAGEAILATDAKRMVLGAIGEFQPEYVIDKFTEMVKEKASVRRITWDDVVDTVNEASTLLKEECRPKREVPLLMEGKKSIDKGLGSGDKLATNYRDNFTDSHVRKQYPSGTTKAMIFSKKPLFMGTAKAAGHIPGYSGHIPRNTLNPLKEDHALGRAKPTQNDLILTRKGTLFSMGNYSGHIPQYSVMKNERCTGCDPLSTMGASFAGKRFLV